MDILFKIKHYVKPYFKKEWTVLCFKKPKSQKNRKRYWIEGFEKNITNKKWKIEDNIPLGLYNGKWETHIKKNSYFRAM